jgi:hypothetical protein
MFLPKNRQATWQPNEHLALASEELRLTEDPYSSEGSSCEPKTRFLHYLSSTTITGNTGGRGSRGVKLACVLRKFCSDNVSRHHLALAPECRREGGMAPRAPFVDRLSRPSRAPPTYGVFTPRPTPDCVCSCLWHPEVGAAFQFDRQDGLRSDATTLSRPVVPRRRLGTANGRVVPQQPGTGFNPPHRAGLWCCKLIPV